MRRITILEAVITVLIIFLVVVVFFLDGKIIGLKKDFVSRAVETELAIKALEKAVPISTKYFLLVKLLTDEAKEKMSAFQIVEIARVIMAECAANEDIGLEPNMVLGIIERESGFNALAMSELKAYGLMQCLQETFDRHLPEIGYSGFTAALAFNPVVNVQVGIKHLIYLRRYWISEGIDSWLWTMNSYFWGIRATWQLLLEKKRAMLPSVEYGKGILDLAKKWKERGI